MVSDYGGEAPQTEGLYQRMIGEKVLLKTPLEKEQPRRAKRTRAKNPEKI